MEQVMVCFQFQQAEGNAESRLRMESSLTGQATEIGGKEAEKLWKKISEIADDFPQGPVIGMSLGGR